MNTADDQHAEDDPDDSLCPHCSGSGEGQHDGTRCGYCKGQGTERRDVDPDEYYDQRRTFEEY